MDTPNNFTKTPVEAPVTRTAKVSELVNELIESRIDPMEHLNKIAELHDIFVPLFNEVHPFALQCLLGSLLDEYCHHNDMEYEDLNVLLEELISVRRENEDYLKSLPYTRD